MNILDFKFEPEDPMAKLMGEAVKEGMWPFRYEGYTIYTDYDIDFAKQRVTAEVFLLNSGDLVYGTVQLGMSYHDFWPTEAALLAADNMVVSLRNRSFTPPADHIVLGEE